MKRLAAALLPAGLLVAGAVCALTDAHAGHHAPATASAAAAMAEGEVRKIDKDGAKITLRHGPIKSLEMPPMTMVFQVKDRALLDKVKVGDKVRFAAEQSSGAYVVTAIETTKLGGGRCRCCRSTDGRPVKIARHVPGPSPAPLSVADVLPVGADLDVRPG